jgi:hypothetical protein
MAPHLFFSGLKGQAVDFSRLAAAWSAITDARLQEYREALPSEWAAGDGSAEDAASHIAALRDNIGPALAEVARILI